MKPAQRIVVLQHQSHLLQASGDVTPVVPE